MKEQMQSPLNNTFGLKPGLQACCINPKEFVLLILSVFSTLETEMCRAITAAELLSYSKNILATKEASEAFKSKCAFLASYGTARRGKNGFDSVTPGEWI